MVKILKRAVGIVLTLSSFLTFLIVKNRYPPIKGEIKVTDWNSGVITTTVTHEYPLVYWVLSGILIITLV